ncbi:hypothetical protein WA158_003033 [Blastocystis sp. Blastoise]
MSEVTNEPKVDEQTSQEEQSPEVTKTEVKSTNSQSESKTVSAEDSESSSNSSSNHGCGLINEKTVIEIDYKQNLLAATTFEDLHLREELIRSVYVEFKYEKPSLIQAQGLPYILQDPPVNLIAQAQNGSGKTGCFVLGMLSRVNEHIQAPQVLCLCPTRELAIQNYDIIQKFGKYCSFTYRLLLKDGEESAVTEQVLVGTPGTINNLIKKRFFNTRDMKMMVIDEADEMLKDANGSRQFTLGNTCITIQKAMPRRNFQLLLFSATFAENVLSFAKKLCRDPVVIKKKEEDLKLDNVPLYFVLNKNEEEKYQNIIKLYDIMNVGQTVIFVNSAGVADKLANFLREHDYTANILYGKMQNETRDRVVKEFKQGITKILIATNVIARGLDVPAVTLVINFEIPVVKGQPDYANFLHRIGRTGRMGRAGVAVSFILKEAESIDQLKSIEQFYHMNMISLNPEDYDEVEHMLEKAEQYNATL